MDFIPRKLQYQKVIKEVYFLSAPYIPASNLGYLVPPGQFFMGAKLSIGIPEMRKEGVLKK